MKSSKHYNTPETEKTIFYTVVAVLMIIVTIVLGINFCKGEDELVKVWVMCKPGSQVNVRRTPDKRAMEVGYLDSGDWFLTDGSSADGWIRCYGIGEYGEGWVYCGYVVTEEPEAVFEQYVCCAPKRVAIRRWMNGPKVDGSAWLTNGSDVDVFYMADEWACTNRGYILREWLEVDPK